MQFMDSSSIFKVFFYQQKKSVKKQYITIFWSISASVLIMNKFCPKERGVSTALSFNKLQNSRTNEDELISKLRIAVSGPNIRRIYPFWMHIVSPSAYLV